MLAYSSNTEYNVSGLQYWRITATAESRALEMGLMAEKERKYYLYTFML
jgi:hypothetical protein